MTYLEFITGISNHPLGWRVMVEGNELTFGGASINHEFKHMMQAHVKLMYETLCKDTTQAARMVDDKSELVRAAASVWLQQGGYYEVSNKRTPHY